MKTFEEKYSAWLDGHLTGDERAEFEKQLGPEALADRDAVLKLGTMLREHYHAPPLRNADFFNHQLTQQISTPAPSTMPRPRASFWTLPRMTWAAFACLAMAFAVYRATVPFTPTAPPTEQEYLAQVLEARSGDPTIFATHFHSKEDNVTVLWLEGLQDVPVEQQL